MGKETEMTKLEIQRFGINYGGGDPILAEVEFCKNWILMNTIKTKRYNRDESSYRLKHYVEDDSIGGEKN